MIKRKLACMALSTIVIAMACTGTVMATAESTPQESTEKTESSAVVVPIIEEEEAQEETNSIPPILILSAPIVLGGIAGWFIRGFVDKRRGIGYIDEEETEDDEGEGEDEEDEDEDEIEEPVARQKPTKAPEPVITLTAEEILAQNKEPDGYDEIKRPYWYDELGQPFTIDDEGNPMYYYSQDT